MRATALDCVYELAKVDDRVFFVGSDLGKGTLDVFKKEIPDRFFMEGISEAHLLGMAAGLAFEGKVPYVNTIATFLSRRSFEQLVVDLCLHRLNVRLIANGGGLVYAPLGPTHLAIEDLSILRAVPNLTIVAPADADEMRRLMPRTLEHQGPIYIRVAKGHDPIVSSERLGFEIGKAIPMCPGDDALLVTTGVTLGPAMRARERLAEDGVDASVLHVHTLKPLDQEAILEAISRVPVVVSVEENTVVGGLGSAVSELIAEAGFDKPKRFKRIGIPDVFPDEYGSQASLMEKFGITDTAICETVRALREKC